MKYQIIFSKHFQRDFNDLECALQQRVLIAIERIKENPFLIVKKLKDVRQGKYRIRVGDYRIRFDILGYRILLHEVRHRRDIYRF